MKRYKTFYLLALIALAAIVYPLCRTEIKNALFVNSSSEVFKISLGNKGEQHLWRFHFKSEGKQDFGLLLNPVSKNTNDSSREEKYESEISGYLKASILDYDAGKTSIAFTFDEIVASISIPDGKVLADSDEIAALKNQPILAVYDAAGEIVSIKSNRTSIYSKLAANVIYRLQVPFYEIRNSIPYAFKENDENGSSSIQIEANLKEKTIKKFNQKYLTDVDSLFSIGADTKVIVMFGDEGIHTMKGSQNLDFVGNQRPFSKVFNSWTFERTRRSILSGVDVANLSKVAHSNTVSLNEVQNSDEQRQRRLVQESNLKDLLKTISDPTFGSSSNRVGKTIAQLVAHLRQDQQAILQVREMIESAALDTPAFVYSLGAMVQAGTPEVQNQLVQLLKSNLAEDSKRLFRVVSQIHDLKHPTTELSNAVVELTERKDDFIARAATLAMGSIVGRMEDGPRKVEVIAGMTGRWQRARSVDEKVLILRALGNSGVSEVISIASMGLAPNESYITRKAAAESLRWSKDPASQQLLLESYSQDSNVEVKRSVLAAFQYQNISQAIVLRLVKDMIMRDGNESLQILIMNTVWKYRDRDPIISQAVESLSSRRSDIGREAKRLLNQI